MDISTEFIYLLCGWSAINGIFLGLYLFFNKSVKKNEANKLLGAIFFLMSFKVAYRVLFPFDSSQTLMHTIYSQWIMICYMMVGLLLYLYTKSLLKNIFYFKKIHLLFLLPLIGILFIPSKINEFSIKFFLIQLWMILFLTLSAIEVIRLKFIEKNEQKKHVYKWLTLIIAGAFVIWVTVLGKYYVELVALFSFIICSLIYVLIEKKGIIHFDYFQKKNTKLKINSQEEEKIIVKLKQIMENEKLYLNSELTLPRLADKLNVPLYALSKIINEKLNKNFSEFVNSYRIDEAKKRLVDDSFNHLNIASIAYDCGFNSLSTFNTFFKKQTSTTPSKFKELQLN